MRDESPQPSQLIFPVALRPAEWEPEPLPLAIEPPAAAPPPEERPRRRTDPTLMTSPPRMPSGTNWTRPVPSAQPEATFEPPRQPSIALLEDLAPHPAEPQPQAAAGREQPT